MHTVQNKRLLDLYMPFSSNISLQLCHSKHILNSLQGANVCALQSFHRDKDTENVTHSGHQSCLPVFICIFLKICLHLKIMRCVVTEDLHSLSRDCSPFIFYFFAFFKSICKHQIQCKSAKLNPDFMDLILHVLLYIATSCCSTNVRYISMNAAVFAS